ncbi:hypothetical protein CHUAL_009270 [Chamberlinius hualienensis]
MSQSSKLERHNYDYSPSWSNRQSLDQSTGVILDSRENTLNANDSQLLHQIKCFAYRESQVGASNDKSDQDRPLTMDFYVSDQSVYNRIGNLYFKDSRSTFFKVVFRLTLKVLSCVIYIVRVILETSRDQKKNNESFGELLSTSNEKPVNWDRIISIWHPTPIWITQVITASLTLLMTVTALIFRFKGNAAKLLTFDLFLELAISVPVIITIFPDFRHIFVPIFLNCWLAKSALKEIFTHRSIGTQSNFSRQLVDVMATIFCLVFTGVCSFEHLQRGSKNVHYDLFQSLYFILVTLSTVGYGDYFPDIWPSQLCMITIVCVALIVLPKQFERLALTWVEMQRLGGSYIKKGFTKDRHIVVCSTELGDDLALDFLNEFYSHRHLQDFHVVFLTSADLDAEARQILQMPIWAHRHTYIKGSCLRDEDLLRTRVNEAEACFILGADNSVDKTAADQHTILRSWAVKDFAPNVPLYVQIFRPQSIIHVKFAEHVVCEDEFKYAMLAYNCMIPGTSTLVTLLLHTSRGQEGQDCKEPWLKLYGKCSGNELYHITAGKSKIFSPFVGTCFSKTAIQCHQAYGVVLIGIRPTVDETSSIMLNPGKNYIIKPTDICFYLSITREEDITFITSKKDLKFKQENRIDSENITSSKVPSNDYTCTQIRRLTANSFGRKYLNQKDDLEYSHNQSAQPKLMIGCPPVTPYVGTSINKCHLLRKQRQWCCLQLNEPCEHCKFKTADNYNWKNRAIILATDYASLGIYNFIVPLRSHVLHQSTLNPIILLLENKPGNSFLDSISWFSEVYWMLGSIDNVDDLLRAGILLADHVVIANKESSNAAEEEEDLADCNTIVGVQTIYKFFPNVKITTELSQSSNMRFMHFQANNSFALYLSEVEKREKENGSIISFMFRLQFASGIVFSASMVDTLLYQAFVKDYLIPIVRLLLGIDQAPGSGFLTSVTIDKKENWMGTYGTLFTHLCSSNGDIPIAIFRTHSETDGTQYTTKSCSVYNKAPEKKQISNLIKSRIHSLALQKRNTAETQHEQHNNVSYVLINPSHNLELEDGDVLFLLRPPADNM